jgi:hypothetical protein
MGMGIPKYLLPQNSTYFKLNDYNTARMNPD